MTSKTALGVISNACNMEATRQPQWGYKGNSAINQATCSEMEKDDSQACGYCLTATNRQASMTPAKAKGAELTPRHAFEKKQ